MLYLHKISFKILLVYSLWFIVYGLSLSAYAASLTDAQKDYLSGDYQEAIEKAKALPQNDETAYFLGLVQLKNGNYDKARQYFRQVVKGHPNSHLSGQAAVKLADTYFFQNDYENAQALYEEIKSRYHNLDNMP